MIRVLVQLSSGRPYAYEVGILSVGVGDEVEVPSSYWMQGRHGQRGRVVALETDYRGPCERIMRVTERVAMLVGA